MATAGFMVVQIHSSFVFYEGMKDAMVPVLASSLDGG
jgi:hypothetical protein